MLSIPTSTIDRRRQQHRRQNSTPAFEAPNIRPVPAIIHRQNSHRRGMSLDQKPMLQASPFLDRTAPTNQRPSSQGDNPVSMTNLGPRPLQHPLQVAQQHRLAQPGPQYQQIQPQPQSHEQSQPPSEQQIKDLEQHIKSVYGSYGTIYVNILPIPITTPTKPPPLAPPPENLDVAPMPTSFDHLEDIKLNPTGPDRPFTFHLESPENDYGYESSYYSDALSPERSPSTSPHQRHVRTFPDGLPQITTTPLLSFSDTTSLLPSSQSTNDIDALLTPSRPSSSPRPMSMTDPSLDATIEDTGVSAEEVQAYISDQDPVSNRWTCLYPGCEKTFGRRENIRSHVQTHLGDRQYRCNHCGKCFVRQHDLKRHAKIHTGDKPYKCPCGGGFARHDALTRHRQRGMCVGGFPGAVRKQAPRGRPRRKRPDQEERVEKANKTRKAAAYASSVSGGSQDSYPLSPATSFNNIDASQLAELQALTGASELSDPFSFDNASSPFSSDSPDNDQVFDSSSPFDMEAATDNLFRISEEALAQTPPATPARKMAPQFDSSSIIPLDLVKSPVQDTTSRHSSNAFTTPPTSPVDDIFSDFGPATTQYENAANVPAMDLSMFCDPGDMLSSTALAYSADEALKASMAWIDSL